MCNIVCVYRNRKVVTSLEFSRLFAGLHPCCIYYRMVNVQDYLHLTSNYHVLVSARISM